jgi:hypothetical protein
VTLARGEAGRAVALAHLEPGSPEIDAHLDRAAAALAERGHDAGLMSGVAGVAFAAAHVARLRGQPLGDAHAEVDDALLGWLAHTEAFDLIDGAAGVGVYALEAGNDDLLDAVAGALERQAADGVWNGDPGMSHGAAGPIAFLAASGRAPALLARAVERLLSVPDPGSRLAWCHGNLGIAVALLRAGAHEEARAAAHRAQDGVEDAGLCHGAAGAGHLLRRLGEALGDAALAGRGRAWLARAEALPVAEEGLLLGAAGVALAQRAPDGGWDRMLLAP